MTIAAIVVTYFPDRETVNSLLTSLKAQADLVYVIDNTPNGDEGWTVTPGDRAGVAQVCHVPLGENLGIAVAHNVGIKAAIGEGATHVVLFDQDSIPPHNMIQTLLAEEKALLERGVRVASVGPAYRDEKTGDVAPAIRSTGLIVKKFHVQSDEMRPVASDHLISSGSLIRTSILDEVGLMREDLFIDWVDIEWGIRARHKGFKHFICPRTIMSHSIGDAFKAILGKKINLHSDLRNYYIVRNAISLGMNPATGWPWRLRMLFKAPLYVGFHTWHSASGNRLDAFMLMLLAVRDGFTGRLGRKTA